MGKEQKDYRFAEIDWGEHLPNDDCETLKKPRVSGYREPSRAQRAGGKLVVESEIQTHGMGLPKEEEGDLVLGSYPKGTVIKFEMDTYSTQDHEDKRRVYWGLLSQTRNLAGETIPCMIYFQESIHGRLANNLGSELIDDINIGQIHHEKVRREGRLDESLRRINWIQLWKLGA